MQKKENLREILFAAPCILANTTYWADSD